MSYQIKTQRADVTFSAHPDETLLEAALRQGIMMPYGCRDGACGACKGKIRQGQVDLGTYQAQALSPAEVEQGLALFCCTRARTDLEIESRNMVVAGEIQVKTLPARVERIERRAPDVMELGLRLPAREAFDFLPGQYVDILLKDGRRRSYSVANTPSEPGLLELHVRHVPGGAFTDHVFNGMKVRDMLRIEGPHGGFFLRKDSEKPAILLASGTGFAPVKSMITQSIAEGASRPLHLYWGCRSRADLYLPELPESWARAYPHIRYTPVLSAPQPEDAWSGRTGFVHEAVMADYPDLAGYQVYACGTPVMVECASRDFTRCCHLPEAEFFSDAFTFATQGS